MTFTAPSQPLVLSTIDSPRGAKNSGGRPAASFWDDMWAAVAAALYDGTLAPKSQADIERAMIDWIEAHGHNAAVSTVRGRARRLWDKINREDS